MTPTAATLRDLDDLVRLFAAYLEFYEVAQPPASIRAFLEERLTRGDSHLLIARGSGGAAIGFVHLYPYQASLLLEPAWLLSDLFVSKAARRHGVGAALMNAARAFAAASGACGIQLETARTNRIGQALYERLGYVRDEAFHTYWLSLSGGACAPGKVRALASPGRDA
ncbi:GNAT family N-acetyltransferase [Pseudomonas sp. RIT-PI-AD]|uniref:GNAT family N-acetyltransferase n=1 Tax=Pseudomonas sp. RIT-PI-AD TaxID=3035294 RepID=UPI0021DAA7B8|nr:GNAT family N-acetyltransferase [Pseudomonas sp. RIT-PI-AD]